MIDRPSLTRNGANPTSKARKVETIGFGCPDTTDPQHFSVTIPRGRHSVVVTEHFGVSTGMNGLPEYIERAFLPREKWKVIADDVQRVFNDRLRDEELKTSRWQTGENKVEKFLGKELTVLVWAIEWADEELIPVALKNWLGLKPEERWWLFTMTAAATGRAEDGNRGWRKALRYALTENPTDIKLLPKKQAKEEFFSDLPLFDLEEKQKS